MGDDPPDGPSERMLEEREYDQRKEGCIECGSDFLPGYVENGPDRGADWTLQCSNAKCRATFDVWEKCCEAIDDGPIDCEFD